MDSPTKGPGDQRVTVSSLAENVYTMSGSSRVDLSRKLHKNVCKGRLSPFGGDFRPCGFKVVCRLPAYFFAGTGRGRRGLKKLIALPAKASQQDPAHLRNT
jgi:hypothetical protein